MNLYILTCTRPLNSIGSTDYFDDSSKASIRLALHSIPIKIQPNSLTINRQGRIFTTAITNKMFLESKDTTRVNDRITFTRL